MYEKNYFRFEDFFVTETGKSNTVSSPAHLGNLACLWDYLNSLREKLGKPIFINSAYRTPEINKQVGGRKRSKHMEGRAADIRCNPKYMVRLRELVEEDAENLSQIIHYSTFIHIAI